MEFISYGKYIDTDDDFRKVECDIYDAIQYFWSYDNCNDYEN